MAKDTPAKRTDSVSTLVAHTDKTHTVYIDHDGTLLPVQHEHPRHQQIFVDGAAHYHVADAPDGVWIYRRG